MSFLDDLFNNPNALYGMGLANQGVRDFQNTVRANPYPYATQLQQNPMATQLLANRANQLWQQNFSSEELQRRLDEQDERNRRWNETLQQNNIRNNELGGLKLSTMVDERAKDRDYKNSKDYQATRALAAKSGVVIPDAPVMSPLSLETANPDINPNRPPMSASEILNLIGQSQSQQNQGKSAKLSAETNFINQRANQTPPSKTDPAIYTTAIKYGVPIYDKNGNLRPVTGLEKAVNKAIQNYGDNAADPYGDLGIKRK